MKIKNKFFSILIFVFIITIINVSAGFNNSDPQTWMKTTNWNSLNSDDLSGPGALEIIKKATKGQAKSYFDGKLPANAVSLSSEEKILLKKIYPKVHDDLLGIDGLIINDKEDSIAMPDGTKVFGISSDMDITMAMDGIKVGDSIIMSGRVSINSDGSINLHQNSKLKNKYATVWTGKIPVTIFSTKSTKNDESTLIFDEEYKHMYVNGRDLEIQLNDDQIGWNFEAGKNIDYRSSYILNRAGEKVIEISEKGLVSSVLGATGDTGFEFGVDAVGNVQNFVSGSGSCCNGKPSPIITTEAIKDITGYGVFNNLVSKCLKTLGKNEIALKYEIKDYDKVEIGPLNEGLKITVNGETVYINDNYEIYNMHQYNEKGEYVLIYKYKIIDGERVIDEIYEAPVLGVDKNLYVDDKNIIVENIRCESPCGIDVDDGEKLSIIGKIASINDGLSAKLREVSQNSFLTKIVSEFVEHQEDILEQNNIVILCEKYCGKYKGINDESKRIKAIIEDSKKEFPTITSEKKHLEFALSTNNYVAIQ